MQRIIYSTIFIFSFLHFFHFSFGQNIGIGTTTPNSSALLDVSSTTKGILLPRMITTQRDAIVGPAMGLTIFNLDDQCTDIFDGSKWIKNCGFKQGDSVLLPQNNWMQKAGFAGTLRRGLVSFSIGNKGYFGTGYDGSYKNDFWEYDPETNAWSQKADFGGVGRYFGVGFSIGNKGYIGTGSNPAYKNDFWEYDPAANTWTQKANFVGTARYFAVGFSINNKGYIGTGLDGARKNDFWEYDPVTNAWTQKANFGGTARSGAIGFSIGNKGYLGTGEDGNDRNDFWEYDPVANVWAPKANFGGTPRSLAVGFSIGNKGYIGTGTDGSNKNDFWEYDPTANTWLKKANLTGIARFAAAGFSIGNRGYIGMGVTGSFLSGPIKDFWEYNQQPYKVTSYATNTGILSQGNFSDGIWTSTALNHITTSRNVGIGNDFPNAPLQFQNNAANRKIVLFEDYNNNHQFYGFGIGNSVMNYQVSSPLASHVFYAGTNDNSSVELLRIQGNGNVGIGNAAPSNKLSVSGNANFTGNVDIGINLGIGIAAPGFPLHFNSTVGDKISLFGSPGPHYGIGIQAGVLQIHSSSSADDIALGYGSSSSFTERMRIKGNGNVGIGVSDPAYTLDLSNRMRIRGAPGFTAGVWLNNEANTAISAFIGMFSDNQVGFFGNGGVGWGFLWNTQTGNATLAGVLTHSSDARLKKEIVPLSNTLDAIQQISGYSYHWKDASNPDEQIGLLAQEIQKVYPQLVKENDQGTLSVNYSGMVPVLLEAIKEQQSQIAELKKLVSQLIKQSK